jgi:hypothetical protein
MSRRWCEPAGAKASSCIQPALVNPQRLRFNRARVFRRYDRRITVEQHRKIDRLQMTRAQRRTHAAIRRRTNRAGIDLNGNECGGRHHWRRSRPMTQIRRRLLGLVIEENAGVRISQYLVDAPDEFPG